MTRIGLILIILAISMNGYGQVVETAFDTSLWHTDFASAKAESDSSDLPVMIVFSGSDWCKPCIKLRETILVNPEFTAWAKTQLVPINLDFPRQRKNALPEAQQAQNDSLAEIYNPSGIFPLVVFINAKGEVMAETGYIDISPAEYILHLETILELNDDK